MDQKEPGAVASTDTLGPLPEPEAWRTQVGPWGDRSTDYAYSANQMRAYAMQERDAERRRVLATVEQRLLTWRQRTMNKSGDRLALDDFMRADTIADLVDYVCEEWA